MRSFPPNLYGLYDIVGNVSEWTSDSVGSMRVFKDGSYFDAEDGLRFSIRNWADPETPRSDLGFRCVLPFSPGVANTGHSQPSPP